jgi:hypothetical protein
MLHICYLELEDNCIVTEITESYAHLVGAGNSNADACPVFDVAVSYPSLKSLGFRFPQTRYTIS